MTEIQRIFIQNLKRFRKEKGYSQMKLAELCNISTNYLSEIEIGRKFPSVETFQNLADTLEVKPYRLLMDYTSLEEFARKDLVLVLSEAVKKNIVSSIDSIVAKYLVAAEKEDPFYNPDKKNQ